MPRWGLGLGLVEAPVGRQRGPRLVQPGVLCGRIGAVAHPPGLGQVVEVVEAREHVVLVVLPVPQQHLVAVPRHVPRHPVAVPGRHDHRLLGVLLGEPLGVLDQPAGLGRRGREGLGRPVEPPQQGGLAERCRGGAAVPGRQRLHGGDRDPGRARGPAGRQGAEAQHRGTVLLGPAEDRRRRHAGHRALGHLVQVIALRAQPVDGLTPPALGEGDRAAVGVEGLQHDGAAVPGSAEPDHDRVGVGSEPAEGGHEPLGTPYRDPGHTRSEPEHAELLGPSQHPRQRWGPLALVGPGQRTGRTGAGRGEQQDRVRHPGQHEVLLGGRSGPTGESAHVEGHRLGPDGAQPCCQPVPGRPAPHAPTPGNRASGHSSSQASAHPRPRRSSCSARAVRIASRASS